MAGEDGAAPEAAGPPAHPGPGGRGYDAKCVFCRICRGEEPGTALLPCESEGLVCFRDIKPGAPHHYLVVPIEHMGNCKTLKKEHIPLVEKMMDAGKKTLQQNNFTDSNDDGIPLASILLNIPLTSSCPGPSQSAGILVQDDIQNQFLLVYHG
ncbi:adenosine 5'-monophosphoramidase HINT3 isoform X2 [Pelodiscus sinensis]|uniref:adenosine 5'-monophosphoramidase HINT3 isoform X2 n=1 Tax=Pelodiscus sinensis TaxID=13735 RepID=UPI003F6C5C2A